MQELKFFKHSVKASSEGGSLKQLLDEPTMGASAYGRYWLFIEMCTARLRKEREERFTEEHMNFTFSSRDLREKLRIRSTGLELFLDYCSTLDLFKFTKVEDKYNFYVPKILETLDRDSNRARDSRATSAAITRLRLKTKDIKTKDRRVAEIFPEASEEVLMLLCFVREEVLLDWSFRWPTKQGQNFDSLSRWLEWHVHNNTRITASKIEATLHAWLLSDKALLGEQEGSEQGDRIYKGTLERFNADSMASLIGRSNAGT